jgi:hypothetical protein
MSSRLLVLAALAVALAATPAESADVHATLRVDPEVPLGADPAGRLRLYAPDPVDPGSSISHWDLVASLDLLMKPFIAPGAPIGEPDLTVELLEDIGWSPGRSEIVVRFADPQGQGFNAPGSLGAERRAAIEHVAAIWSGLLQSSVPIHVEASFRPLPCSNGSATLAQAGPAFIFESFAGADIQNAWYPGALAEALAGQNLSIEDDVNPEAADIHAEFNSAIDSGCLGAGAIFDYSLDGTAQPGRLSFVNVALHELGHGLGFVTLVDESTGANPMGKPDIFSFFVRDASTGLLWHQMSDAGRVASARNTGRVVWDGPNVNATAPSVLEPGPVLLIDAPASIDGSYEVAPAAFGADLSENGLGGYLVAAQDGTASPREGCRPFTNAGEVKGRIAVVVRGGCNYDVKARHAQNAGATGLIVVNNVPGPPIAPGGSDSSISIPVVMVRKDDGALLLQALGASQPNPTPPPPPPPPSASAGNIVPEVRSEAPSTCVENGSTLCLENDRFRVRARYTTRAGSTGNGHAVALTADSGHFWFFDPENVEVVLKVKNACAAPWNHFWVFAAGLTDVDVALEVADTMTGRVLTYHNPQGRAFPPVQDTDAFPTCP